MKEYSKKVYMLIGLPGSGKSTWAKKKAKEGKTVIVNQDAIRTMLKAEYFYDKEYEPLVHEMAVACLGDALGLGFDVILDQTNLSRSRRMFWVNLIKDNFDCQIIYVHFCVMDESNLDRRMNEPRGQTREQWAEIIESMKKYEEMPLKSEGYDWLILEG